MGSLANLYISQSYQSLLKFSTDNSASATLTMLQDGVGQNLYTYVNTNGDLLTSHSISSSIIEATNLIIKDKIEVTGSIDINASVTASNAFIENNLIVSGTLFANKIVTTIESSSVIFSSGSNILGDTTADTQTLIGSVIMSGSSSLTGSMGITGEVSSSTIAGLGNATTFSQSVDSRLDYLEGGFSQSVDNRLDQLELFTASADNKFNAIQSSTASLNQFTQSAISKFDEIQVSTSSLNAFTQSTISDLDSIHQTTASLNAFTASLVITFVTTASLQATASFLQNQIDQKLFTSSFNQYTSSNDAKVDSLINATSSYAISSSVANSINGLSSSIAITNNVQTTRIDALASFTGSYATTGSNTFRGNEIFSGSVRGVVLPITIASNTASMDCSLGNFFTLSLPAGTTHLLASNINPGETLSLKIANQTSASVLTYNSSIKFPTGAQYTASVIANSIDILTFVSFDTTTLYGAAANKMS